MTPLSRPFLTMDLRLQRISIFLKVYHIKHTFNSTYRSATNGEAERFVQTFKNNMKDRQATSSTANKCIDRCPIANRSTPHATRCLPYFY